MINNKLDMNEEINNQKTQTNSKLKFITLQTEDVPTPTKENNQDIKTQNAH